MSATLYNNSDFDELILMHLTRSQKVYDRAKALKMEGDDFLTSLAAGIQVYKTIGQLLLDLNIVRPIVSTVLDIEVQTLLANNEINDVTIENLKELLDSFYIKELQEDYVEQHLFEFIKHRRLSKVQQTTTDSTEMYEEMKQVAEGFENIRVFEDVVDVNPFDRPIYIEQLAYRAIGFDGLEAHMGGFQPEECSLLMAGSGVGKTACAVNIANCISEFVNVGYFSLEEPNAHLTQRFYARKFGLNYSKLRYGNPEERMLLNSAFADLTALDRQRLRGLKIIDARHMTPVTVNTIKGLLTKYANEGFIIDTIIIDQMDYLSPVKTLSKGADRWKEYEQIAFECDELSMFRILDQHPISVIVLHQLKGAPTWDYTVDDIAGFKGIIKPFDLALAIGKHHENANYIKIQSLKVRHFAPFALTYQANFENMNFTRADWAPQNGKEDRNRKKQEDEEKRFNDLHRLKDRARVPVQ